MSPSPRLSASPTPILSDEQQLRALVEHIHMRAGRPNGKLTREQEAALRVLTRPERALDTEALWAPAIY